MSYHKGATEWLAAHAADVSTVIKRTEREDCLITYEVIVVDSTLLMGAIHEADAHRSLWSKEVHFGQTDATVAGGRAFQLAAAEQEWVASDIWRSRSNAVTNAVR